MDFKQAMTKLDGEELLKYLHEDIFMKGKHEELMKTDNEEQWTALMLALNEEKSTDVIFKLIEIGGKELLMKQDSTQNTVLHDACHCNTPVEVILKLIEIGEKDLVLLKNDIGETALTKSCEFNPNIEVITKLIEVGGSDLVMAKNQNGETALHFAITMVNAIPMPSARTETIFKLIESGGRDLIFQKDERGYTALHRACKYNAPIEVISKLIEVAGPDLVIERDENGATALHLAFYYDAPPIETISKLIDVGGRLLVLEKDEDFLGAIHAYFHYPHNLESNYDDCFVIMLKEGILSEIDDYEIGGLFVDNDEIQRTIYDDWEEISDYLETAMQQLQQEEQIQPPILHAAIRNKAPEHILQSIIERFRTYDCLLTRDSRNRLPINIAVEDGLPWDKGMREVIEEMAAAQQQPMIIYTAAHYGLKWSDGMKELVDSNVNEVINGHDSLTGLSLSMVAAMGDSSDLSSIYSMKRMNPEL